MFTVFLFNARGIQFFSSGARQALAPAFQEVFLSRTLNLGFHCAQLKTKVQMSDIRFLILPLLSKTQQSVAKDS